MKAKSLMVLGTASGAGKSVLTAGLCRLFSDWGYRVAPFKAQNMSNNSFVTESGEIGRAQAVQAECARVKPTVDMNPLLLKPAGDNRSQVVVHGEAIGHFTAREYYAQKEALRKAVRLSYEKLAAEYEILVMEGAGSPAEINLKDSDLVNMPMAEMAEARCVLVGDIERGGVFASLVGTLELLSAPERSRIDGLIINKFRGDQSLLDSGLRFLEGRSGKKVWGVIPHDPGLWIEEEDGLEVAGTGPRSAGDLDIAVVHLPRISNFTDFDVLKREPGVSLRYVRKPADLGLPDLLILPGTKATISDLRHLSETGLLRKISEFASSGGRILGICGGYQMMGRTVRDPAGVESGIQEMKGLGFFNIETEFYPEKILRQITGSLDLHLWGGMKGKIQAYEIHMGQTVYGEPYPSFGEGGAVHPNGKWAGTYYHGLFDHQEFRKSFLKALATAAGKKLMPENAGVSIEALKEKHYQRLKDLLVRSLNMDYLRECLRLPSPSCSTS